MANYDAIGGAGVATVFSNRDCSGRSGVIYTYGVYDEWVAHDMASLNYLNIWNDSISSVMVPHGYTLELREGEIWDSYSRTMSF
jgi:hypothetical protein